MKIRAIVTGGCGFIGGYVVKELVKRSYEVVVIDNLSKGTAEKLPEEASFVEGDICDYELLSSVIQENDTIFHLAALTSVPESIENPLPYHTTNISGTYTVLEVARVKKVRGVVFSSSAAVYGSKEGVVHEELVPHPESPYALQKLLGEKLCESYSQLYSIPCVCLRYFNVYGEGNHEEGSYAPVTARFLKARKNNKPLTIIGDGKQSRDFIHVRDVAKANVASISLFDTHPCTIINVCSGESHTILDIAGMIGGELEFLPPRNEIKNSCGDATKMKKLLAQDVTHLKDGLQELL